MTVPPPQVIRDHSDIRSSTSWNSTRCSTARKRLRWFGPNRFSHNGAHNTTMHELSIAISMIEQICEESAVHGGTAIVAVHLLLGRLSGVDKAALMFCYEAATEGTLLEGSHLVIEEVPIAIYCVACRMESHPQSMQQLTCPRCNFAAKVVRGYELEIGALEVLA